MAGIFLTPCPPSRLYNIAMRIKPAFGTVLLRLSLLVCAAGGCDRDRQNSATPAAPGGARMDVKITSTAFQNNQPIPRKYTGEGDDVSPPLSWSHLPDGTKELALIVDD